MYECHKFKKTTFHVCIRIRHQFTASSRYVRQPHTHWFLKMFVLKTSYDCCRFSKGLCVVVWEGRGVYRAALLHATADVTEGPLATEPPEISEPPHTLSHAVATPRGLLLMKSSSLLLLLQTLPYVMFLLVCISRTDMDCIRIIDDASYSALVSDLADRSQKKFLWSWLFLPHK